jgi:hypothetical protein
MRVIVTTGGEAELRQPQNLTAVTRRRPSPVAARGFAGGLLVVRRGVREALLEAAKSLTEPLADVREARGAEQDQNDDDDDEPVRQAERSHGSPPKSRVANITQCSSSSSSIASRYGEVVENCSVVWTVNCTGNLVHGKTLRVSMNQKPGGKQLSETVSSIYSDFAAINDRSVFALCSAAFYRYPMALMNERFSVPLEN